MGDVIQMSDYREPEPEDLKCDCGSIDFTIDAEECIRCAECSKEMEGMFLIEIEMDDDEQ